MSKGNSETTLKIHASSSNFLLGELEHPNRMPFSGIMTYFDVPSENPPNGSGGKRVMIPSDVGTQALDSLIGMAVNFIPFSMDGHNPQNKIGVITNYSLGEKLENGAVPVIINGYIYAMDFEDAAVQIKLNQASLGFSYETAKTLLIDGLFEGEEVSVVSQLGYFTGASILLKESAAYTQTALAASKEEEVTDMDLEKLLQSISDLIDEKLAKFAEQDKAEDKEVEKEEEVEAKADDKKEDDHEEMHEEMTEEKVEEDEEPKDAKADEEVKAEDEAKADEDASETKDEKEDLKAEIEALKAELKGLKASVDLTASARKSVAHPTTLMAKYDVKEDSYENLMAAIDKMENLSVEERMALKFEARQKTQGRK